MTKLELWYPVKPWKVNWGFGVSPEKYAWLGIAGHNGLDIQTVRNQVVKAAHDGIITFAGQDASAGWGVVIRTEDQREYNGGFVYFKTIYWHLVENIPVRAGQRVKAGDAIGYADSTGWSTGDHLHFGLKPVKQGEQDWEWYNAEQDNGYKGAIDPTPFFNGKYAQDVPIMRSIIETAKKTIELLKVAIAQKMQ